MSDIRLATRDADFVLKVLRGMRKRYCQTKLLAGVLLDGAGKAAADTRADAEIEEIDRAILLMTEGSVDGSCGSQD